MTATRVELFSLKVFQNNSSLGRSPVSGLVLCYHVAKPLFSENTRATQGILLNLFLGQISNSLSDWTTRLPGYMFQSSITIAFLNSNSMLVRKLFVCYTFLLAQIKIDHIGI